ncbi:sensor histidine kinase [Streptococcus gordonii]|uniref:sensor histidine kinase n=1 Tax=Streptococcus gordonii TaxID=1302 RepID=UPI001CBC77D2|nr:HAMP domain-containing sensor histidine kinase [Streptococcus gordonii]MBZ2132622.1 HAMP domain-containing histidine kinase [Streptococcus gordonii]MBZ2141029.1 HAMP domain-containing histidine kinase [Streptococcus gordonii]MBZ2143849.1 HAMP domain-containing histidine kinase [Streptococcus gordonii]MBZ2145780.1 HAMP domain-containing histidine kinase [Streptococcus gordonii]
MLSGIQNREKKGSIVLRITLWYSSFLFVFILVLLGLAFLLSSNLADAAAKRELIESATEISQKPSEYEPMDDGIFYSIYDSSGNLVKKSLPSDFDESLPFNQSVVTTVTVAQKTYLYFDIEIKNSGQWLRAVTLSSHTNHEWNDYLTALAFISPFILVLIIAGGYGILKKALRPIDQLSYTAVEIRESGNFSKRLELTNRDDELHRLGLAFNLMLDSLEASFQREKQFNHDVSHELRTPVAVVLSESEYGLHYAENLDESKESFEIINRQSKRMKEMISHILDLSRLENQPVLVKKSLSLSDLLADKLVDFQKLSQDKGIVLEASIDEECLIVGDEFLLHRLLDNLISNALKFTKDRIELSLRKLEGVCQLTVADNGVGIASSEKDKIWNRFYQVDQARNKNSREGSGLGLALVRKIADLHQIQIELVSELGQGSRFILTFQLEKE